MTDDWSFEQSQQTGYCTVCDRLTRLRLEPYTEDMCCRSCWERIVFEDDPGGPT